MSETSPVRVDNPRLLGGRANFTDDVQLDRMMHAVFAPSPMAHTEIFRHDKEPASGWRARRHHGGGSAVYLREADFPVSESGDTGWPAQSIRRA